MLGIAGAVVLLAVIAALITTLLINPDRYRGNIESVVLSQTGRPLVLQGHLQLTWFPWLGMRTGAARLGNPPGGSGPDLIDWQSAQVQVHLLPLLLHRKLEVARISITGANIRLRRGPQGAGNWDDLSARLQSAGEARGAPTSGAARASLTSNATWAGLDLTNCSLDYVDERTGGHVGLADWQLSVGPWSIGEPLSARTSFVLHGRLAGSRAWLLPAAGVPVSLDLPRLQIQGSPLEVAAPQFSLSIANGKLDGSLDVGRDTTGQPTGSGSLHAAVPSLRQLIRTLGIGISLPNDPSTLGALSLSGSWSYRDGELALEPLAVKLDATTLTGWVRRSSSNPLWTFALRADQVDFGRYMRRSKQQKPLELPRQALQAVHAQGTVELGRAQIDGMVLKNLRLQVQ